MEGKYHNYVKEWRKDRGLSQRELVARLVELVGGRQPEDPELRIPTTEASLSRIENGKQNFNMATLYALAEALNVDEPGWLLDRNPAKAGEVVDFHEWKLSVEQAKLARQVLTQMFGEREAT